MAETTTQLITGAYYASGIVGREFETVGGEEVNNALEWLNELIGKKVVANDAIPYETQTTFTGVAGQEDYTVSDLIHIDTLTFVKDSIRYGMSYVPRNQYRGSTRVETIDSLPYQYYYEREFGGATVSIYFPPDQAYVFTITGIFRLTEITSLTQDLSLTLDRFYRTFLRYELAEKICTEYSMPVPANVEREVEEYRSLIKKQSRPFDLAIRKRSTLQRQKRANWAFVNLSNGFVP